MTHTLVAGDLEAVFLPSHGMLGASLRHRGVEILRRVENLETSAAKGSTAGIPFLHPWANRLAGFSYRAAGREVTLDPSSPLLHLDANGLPMHGVPWPLLVWELTEAKRDFLKAKLEWSRSDLLAIFPFRHQLELTVTLQPDSLTLETTLVAGQASFSVLGAGRQITVEFLAGYRYAQIFAPKESDYIALEPMTAPTSALTSGRGLRLANAGEKFRAMFRIWVEAVS